MLIQDGVALGAFVGVLVGVLVGAFVDVLVGITPPEQTARIHVLLLQQSLLVPHDCPGCLQVALVAFVLLVGAVVATTQLQHPSAVSQEADVVPEQSASTQIPVDLILLHVPLAALLRTSCPSRSTFPKITNVVIATTAKITIGMIWINPRRLRCL